MCHVNLTLQKPHRQPLLCLTKAIKKYKKYSQCCLKSACRLVSCNDMFELKCMVESSERQAVNGVESLNHYWQRQWMGAWWSIKRKNKNNKENHTYTQVWTQQSCGSWKYQPSSIISTLILYCSDDKIAQSRDWFLWSNSKSSDSWHKPTDRQQC